MDRLRYRLFLIGYGLQRWLARRLTPAGWLGLSCLMITAVAGSDTHQTLAYQVFAFLWMVMAIAFLYSFTFRGRFGIQRTLPPFASVGMAVSYRVVVRNYTSRFQRGLWLMEEIDTPLPHPSESPPIIDKSASRNSLSRSIAYYRWLWNRVNRPLGRIRMVEIPPIPPKGQVEVRLTLQPFQRGPLPLKGVTILRPGPFGLCYGYRRIALPEVVWILPPRYALSAINLPGMRRYQSGGVALASAVGESDEFRSLRDYQPGDPLRKIHWKSWAKTGKPVVREDQDEFFVRHALILDTFLDTVLDTTQEDWADASLEAALSVAASFACEVRTQESLLDLMFVGPEAYCFTVGRGVGHTEQMLRILAAVEPCRDRPFNTLHPLILERASILSGCICVFLTWDQARQDLVQTLRALQLPTLVLVLTLDKAALVAAQPADPPIPHDVRVLELSQLQEELMTL
ncbi:MAG: DUF58 domain-containing protein [Leptolyngbyaceae bacterium]|nr:DUF58 domain-containing protein [Leptolyngbyaceae bacterium]